MWKLYEIPMPVSISNILCELRHIHLFTCGPMAAFMQGWVFEIGQMGHNA